MGIELILSVLLTGVFGFIGWYIKGRLTKLENIDLRVNTLETKWDILGDINTSLHALRTDIEIIKSRINN